MPRSKKETLPITSLPESAYLLYQQIQRDLLNLTDLCIKFDKGNDIAGQKFRKELSRIRRNIVILREEIQRIRYYREALAVFQGRKNYIDNRKFKEMRYGKVSDVAKFQILQKCQNYNRKRR